MEFGFDVEDLMSYGWAILVILISIGGLIYFSDVNPNRPVIPENKCYCNEMNLSFSQKLNYEGFNYYECFRINKTIEYILFMCDNNTLQQLDSFYAKW